MGRACKRKKEDTPSKGELPIVDPDHKKRLATLVKRGVETTRFPSKAVLQELGLYDEVRKLFYNIEWQSLLDDSHVDRKTYPKATLEIMSTLEVEVKGKSWLAANFLLNNKKRRITSLDIAKLFGVRPSYTGGISYTFNHKAFWDELVLESNRPFVSGLSKVTHIRNPIFRMVVRILAHTVFARKDNGGVKDDELYILWAMIHGVEINISHFFLKHLYKHALASSGVICIGGMLTPWAKLFKSDIFGWPPLAKSTSLDFIRLRDMKFLKSSKEPYFFMLNPEESFPLPNPELVKVTNANEKINWLMNTEAHYHVIVMTKEKDATKERRVILREDEDEGEGMEIESPDVHSESGQESIEERVKSLEVSFEWLSSQVSIMRQDMEKYQKEESDRFRAIQEDARVTREDTRAMREMMARLEAHHMGQGNHSPSRPPPQ